MPIPPAEAPRTKTDAELVAAILAGDRDGFEEIVRRYQTLVCSLAYSATGDLGRSEDLAQETFLAAWRQLAELREPSKLRAWICGIARNRIHDAVRSQSREPTHGADLMDAAGEPASPEALPADYAASQDEKAVMWRALERIPEAYREPLILFHRENQSIERVAEALDLSEDAVRQRLVRGRRLLQAEVEALVEGALRRTAPGREFTSSVMQALPVSAAVKAGAVVGAAAKGTAGGGLFGLATTIMASPIAPVALVYFARKIRMAEEERAPSDEERELRKGKRRDFTVGALAMAGYIQIWGHWFRLQTQVPWFAPILGLVPGIILLVLVFRALRTDRRIREVRARTATEPARSSFEFLSRGTLLGLPLVHIRFRASNTPVKAWLAVGNVAYGAVFACGRVAVAPLSLGIFSLGLLGAGAFAAGGLAVGLQAAGVLALGLCAAGWMAKGAVSFGYRAAYGLEAYARSFAGSPQEHQRWTAFALHANDSAARQFFGQDGFFVWTRISATDFRRVGIGLLCCGLAFGIGEIAWKLSRLRRRPKPA
jgi:RNA polymerase sigma factor (sigma-70 family)